MNVNKIGILKDNITLKNASVSYDIYNEDVLDLNISVDRPDDYYFPGDNIIFMVRIKNNGNKTLRNIQFRDVMEDEIVPLEDSYEVLTTTGEYVITDNIINVVNITLEPNEENIITIKGKIKEIINDKNNIINT
ncbi:MAG: hypothetical protein ACI35W_04385 [Anaeroplasmataceae bacterium]